MSPCKGQSKHTQSDSLKVELGLYLVVKLEHLPNQ